MFFHTSTTYALRALAYLAGTNGETVSLGREVAERVRVPPPYLAKILSTLARAGLVQATRGVRGGYRLARPAAEIRLVEIVEPFEGKQMRLGCLLDPEKLCTDEHPCSAHAAASCARAAFLAFLENTKLADIRADALLSLPRVPAPKAVRRRPPRA